MSRIIDIFEQFLDGNGDPLENGYLQFFQNGTAITEPTYNDPDETILNPTDVPLDGEGRITLNVYGSVLYTVKLFNSDDVQQGSNDNVRPRGSADAVEGQLELWDAAVTYNVGNVAKGSDGVFYESITDGNINNNPTDPSPTNWKVWATITVWNTNVTYFIGNVVQSSVGNLWKALTDNTGNDPETDDGTNWRPAINGQWISKSTAFNIVSGNKYQIDASAGAVDAALSTSYEEGDSIIVHNESVSTNTVRLTNTALTLKGTGDTITTSDNLVLAPGDTPNIAMKTSTTGEFV